MMKDLVTPDVLDRLKTIRETETALSNWHEAMPLLVNAGVIELLKDLAKMQLQSASVLHYSEATLFEAGRSHGVIQAIEVLMHLRELLFETPITSGLPADFGGLDAAVKNNDITEEEANAIRRNEPIPKLARVPIADFTASAESGSKTES